MPDSKPRITKIGIKKANGEVDSFDIAVESEDVIDLQGKPVQTANIANKLGTTTLGDENTPIYLLNGVPQPCSFNVKKNVPSNASFSDTRYAEVSQTNPLGLLSYNDYQRFNTYANQSPSIATKENAGLVKPGDGLQISNDGTLTIDIPLASAETYGLVKLGTGFTVDGENKLNVATPDNATDVTNGFMSAEDKAKLDLYSGNPQDYIYIPTEATSYTNGIAGVMTYSDLYDEEIEPDQAIAASSYALYQCYTYLSNEIKDLSDKIEPSDIPEEENPDNPGTGPIPFYSPITVGTSNGSFIFTYNNLTDAIQNATSSNNIIDVYNLNDTTLTSIDKAVIIRGNGNTVLGDAENPITIGQGALIVGVKISNVTFNSPVVVYGINTEFENCTFSSSTTGIVIRGENTTFKNCTFEGPETAIQIFTSGTQLFNNIFNPPFRYGGEEGSPADTDTDYYILDIQGDANLLAINNSCLDEHLKVKGTTPIPMYGSRGNNLDELNA